MAEAEAKTTTQEVKTVVQDQRRPSLRRPMRQQRDRKQFGKRDRDNEFEKRIVSIRRVARTYSGGKRMRLSVCLVVGDKKGKVGIAIAKGADVITAEAKAYNKAKKSMVQVNLVGKTVAHQIFHKKGAARIMLRPAAPGTGVIAGAALRAVLEVTGVEDILTKVIGSNNSINNAYACIEALQSLKQPK
jgi:small subunit ribosomal protein S5